MKKTRINNFKRNKTERNQASVSQNNYTRRKGAVAKDSLVSANIVSSIFMALMAIFILISVSTYHANDASLNVVNDYEIRNMGGRYGAIFSDILLQYFGFSAFLLSFLFLVWAINLYRNVNLLPFFISFPLSLFTVLSFSVLCSFSTNIFKYQMLSGGYIGYYLFNLLNHFIGYVPMFFSAAAVFLFGLYAIVINTVKLKKIKISKSFIKSFFLTIFKFFYNLITLKFLFSNWKEKKLMAKAIFLGSIKPKDIKGQSMPIVKKETSNIPKNPLSEQGTSFIPKENILPNLNLLQLARNKNSGKKAVNFDRIEHLMQVLNDFGVRGQIIDCISGPVVDMYQLKPNPGTKSSRVIGLSTDIARTMQVASARIAPVPEKDLIGIELPNGDRQSVYLRTILESNEYKNTTANIPIVLGVNIVGVPIVVDLSKMPHLLIAGTTGSGKSVGLNGMILSMLYKLPYNKCKFIMVDPKMLELSLYDGIPNLLRPVITDPEEAVVALKWVVSEMLRRYKAMSEIGVRNIQGYNEKCSTAKLRGVDIVREIERGYDSETGQIIIEKIVHKVEELPYIVVIIDEIADLMLVAGKEVESSVQRLAQMARAAGIHIIMATQRPSVDVITGVIKANFPTRVSYSVTSKIDSRTILGEQGAEQLLGSGDMLYMGPLGNKPIIECTRVHGPFVSDEEVEEVAKFLRTTGSPEYVSIDMSSPEDSVSGKANVSNKDDDLYQQAVAIVYETKKTSISYVQRKLRIGYNKAANLIELMEEKGVLSPPDNSGKRRIINNN